MKRCAFGGLLYSYGAGVSAGTAFSRGGSKKVAASGVKKEAGEETIVEGGIKQSFLPWKAWKACANLNAGESEETGTGIGRWMGIHLATVGFVVTW